MGLLDSLFGGQGTQPEGLSPNTVGLLDAAAAYAPSLQYSRLPQSPMAGLMAAAGGYGQGYLTGQTAQIQTAMKNAQLAQLGAGLAAAKQYGFLPPNYNPPGLPTFGGSAASPAASAAAPQPAQLPTPAALAAANQPGVSGPAPDADPTAGADVTGGGAPSASELPGAPAAAPSGAPGAPAPQQAPQGAQPPLAGAPLPGAGVVGPAMGLNFLFPGSGKEIIGKQFPGPTDAQRALAAAGIDANSPQGQQILRAAAANAGGYKPVLGGERPGVPIRVLQPDGTYKIVQNVPLAIPGTNQVDLGNGNVGFTRAPGADYNMGANAGIEQGAIAGREAAMKRLQAGIDTGEDSYSGGAGGGGPSPANRNGTPLPAQPFQPKPSAATAVVSAQDGATPQVAAFVGKPFQTEKGTVIPPERGNQVMGPGVLQTTKQIENGAKTEENWNSVRPSIESARDRLNLSAQIFSQLEGKGLNEQKAAASSMLRGAGLNTLADMVMSAKDTSGVQLAVWNSMQEALQSLKAINQGTGGRILNSEFNAFMDKGYSPDMMGATLRTAITHQLGQIYQTQNMIDDYGTARQMNWRDANQYQAAYLKANPLEGFVNYTDKAIPAFKGTDAASPAAAPRVPSFPIGQTATGPNGAKIEWNGKAWEPVVNGQ